MSWAPANEAEAAMADALGRGDTAGFFRAALANPLYLPAVHADLVDGRARQLFTAEVDGQRYVLVFTAPEAAAAVAGADTVVATDYRELVAAWPDPSCRLALNPDSPIAALVTPDAPIRAALGEATVPLGDTLHAAADAEGTTDTDAPDGGGFRPANASEQGLAVALAEDDPDLLLDVLVTTSVLVPTREPVDASALDRPHFPWRRVEDTVAVFTSRERLTEVLPPSVPTVTADLLDVVAVWPPRTWLAVNPGTRLEVTVAPGRVPDLLDWAATLVGRYPADGGPADEETVR